MSTISACRSCWPHLEDRIFFEGLPEADAAWHGCADSPKRFHPELILSMVGLRFLHDQLTADDGAVQRRCATDDRVKAAVAGVPGVIRALALKPARSRASRSGARREAWPPPPPPAPSAPAPAPAPRPRLRRRRPRRRLRRRLRRCRRLRLRRPRPRPRLRPPPPPTPPPPAAALRRRPPSRRR